MKRKNRAQSLMEYGVVIIVVAIALVAMRTYLVRSFQEKYRQTGDVFGEGEQFKPGLTQATESKSTKDIPDTPEEKQETCSNVLAQITQLKAQNKDNLQTATKLDKTSADLQKQAKAIKKTAPEEAKLLLQQAQELTGQANSLREQVIINNQTIAQLTADYPDCF